MNLESGPMLNSPQDAKGQGEITALVDDLQKEAHVLREAAGRLVDALTPILREAESPGPVPQDDSDIPQTTLGQELLNLRATLRTSLRILTTAHKNLEL